MVSPEAVDGYFATYCKDGDVVALGRVFDLTVDPLMRAALWFTRARSDAEDVVQRTFLQAMQTRAQYQHGRPALPWLLGLLANQARKQRSERSPAPDTWSSAAPPRDPSVDACGKELAECVQAITESVGEPYSRVLQLHLQEGLIAKEIAVRLQRPPGTVRTQLVRALAMVRERMPSCYADTSAAIVPIGLASMREAISAHACSAAGAGAAASTASASRLVSWAATALAGSTLVSVPGVLIVSTLVVMTVVSPLVRPPSASAIATSSTGAAMDRDASVHDVTAEELAQLHAWATGPVEDLIDNRLVFLDYQTRHLRQDRVLWAGIERLCAEVLVRPAFPDRRITAALLAQVLELADRDLKHSLESYIRPLRQVR